MKWRTKIDKQKVCICLYYVQTKESNNIFVINLISCGGQPLVGAPSYTMQQPFRTDEKPLKRLNIC